MSACSVFRETHGDPATWSAQTIEAYLDACLADRNDCPVVGSHFLIGGTTRGGKVVAAGELAGKEAGR